MVYFIAIQVIKNKNDSKLDCFCNVGAASMIGETIRKYAQK